jgi:hypothetical protein
MNNNLYQVRKAMERKKKKPSPIDRFDRYVMARFSDPQTVNIERDRILHECMTNSEISRLALSHYIPNATPDEDEAAFRAIVDYFFELAFLPTMGGIQLRSYFTNLTKNMDFEIVGKPQLGQPILLESIHHTVSFSTIYIAVDHLIAEYDYNKVILLHQQVPLDIRAQALGSLVSEDHGVAFTPMQVEGNWFNSLLNIVDSRTIVLYMGDMPLSIFNTNLIAGSTSNRLNLSRSGFPAVVREGFSMAQRLKLSLNGQHAVIDYPLKDQIRLSFTNDSLTQLHSSLVDWVFWPCLDLFDTSGGI